MQKIIKALKEGKYTIEVELPQNVDEYISPLGKHFLVTYGDCDSNYFLGRITINVEGISFVKDIVSEERWYNYDITVTDKLNTALNNVPGAFVCVDPYDDAVRFYCHVFGIDFSSTEWYKYYDDIPYYLLSCERVYRKEPAFSCISIK